MRLLTHNMLSSNIKSVTNGFPLRLQVEKSVEKEVDLNPDFLKNIFPKIEWKALVDASRALGYPELPDEAEPSMLDSHDFLKKFHHALLELHVEEGALICPKTGRNFPINKGIPNMLLHEDEEKLLELYRMGSRAADSEAYGALLEWEVACEGSVRMPAALCGVVGFKPTFGRISHLGVVPLNWTVGMVGILAGTVEDAFIAYAAISGHLPLDQSISLISRVSFPVLKSTSSISNLKLAKYGEWFNDCSDEIRSCCKEALDRLCEHYAWKTVEVTVPEIEAMRLAHYTTIASECTASLGPYLEKLNIAELGCDARVGLSIYRSFSSKEYLNAQRLSATAYPIQNDALKYGELDYINGAAYVRFQIAGNFLGLPAVTIPVGYGKSGMPIGLQFIGPPWSEATLLHLAFAMQCLCAKSYRKPMVFYDLLKQG